ncbi:MAG: alpha/beta hydrolase [bacterium]|nr:alpha/beta hydrolase [bacterium]
MKTELLILSFGDYSLGAKRFLHGETLSDPAIVLLHDALGCMETWKEFPQTLFDVTGLDVVMFDRRGHGVSSALSDEQRTSAYLENDARRLPEILDKLGVRRAILVGHSDGGSIALVAAALWPERVQSVVAMAAHVFLEEVTLAGVRDTVATAGETRLLERLEKYHGEKSERLYRGMRRGFPPPPSRQWHSLPISLPSIGGSECPPPAPPPGRPPPPRRLLCCIPCPVLVMQGELDEYGTVEQVNAIVKGVGEKARAVMYPGVGHAVWRECEGDVVRETKEFLEI